MKTNSTIRRTTLGVAGAAMAAAALLPAAAQAQQYGGYGYDQRGQYYDPCGRDQTGRTVVGAVIGGLAGMALGNNVVNDQRRGRYGRVHDNDTGATVGAVVGSIAGASIGRNSAACSPQRQPAYRSNSYSQGYTPDYGYQYGDRGGYDYRYSQPQYAPQPSYGYQDYGYQDYGYQDYGYGSRGAQACRMVESRIRMPDGRSQTRMVQACPDSQGRYQIVD